MRSPEHRKLAQPRAGRQFEDELQLRYLSPGAFTVLPPETRHPSSPPSAPEPYRLTPGTSRHRNQAFAIIGETDSGFQTAPTRSSSPFRGRGFNPIGSRHNSRHASPTTSPTPPDDARYTPTVLSPTRTSKIPQLKRRGSSHFGEKVSHHEMSPTKRKISNKFSQSMTSLESGKISNRPPPSPKRTAYSKAPAFEKLSPILGSSPEPSQSVSSPSKIPRSRSTPPSRKQSPNRTQAATSGKPPHSKGTNIVRNASRNPSRVQSRNPSRGGSRETSPTKSPNTPLSPSRIPVQKYKHVQAKVNSLNKPKVPPKSQVLSEQSEDSEPSKNIVHRKPLNRKDSVNRLRNNSNSNMLPKTNSSNNKNNNNSIISKPIHNSNKSNNSSSNNIPSKNNSATKTSDKKNGSNEESNQTKSKINITGKDGTAENNTSNTNNSSDHKEEAKVLGEKITELLPSTTAFVSSTTTTVTQPLKIEANLNPPQQTSSKPISPMIDGRVLSATSVSNAINRMNDTVLDTKTIIRDHGLNKITTPPNSVITASSENHNFLLTSTPETKSISEPPSKGSLETNVRNLIQNNHTNHVGLGMNSKDLEMEVQKNLNKLINSDLVRTNSAQRTINDTIKQARPDLPSDIKPIRITVSEKPSDVEVQSGNVRVPIGVTNGLSDRPGLPPTQQPQANETEKESEPPPPKNVCTKFLANCKRKMTCECCKKNPQTSFEERKGENKTNVGCLSCFRKQKKEHEAPPARISFEDETGKRTKWTDRLKCCGKSKVSDSTSCFSLGKRKNNWAERRNSILNPNIPKIRENKCSRECCKDFWKKIFCLNSTCCKKKPVVEEPIRKPSVQSKKKSLTPTTLPPPEDTTPKIDISLVEHTSHMRGAIPILPICLAWFCLVMNCIAPGIGTFLSGVFCLCLGIPRFSQKDGPKARIGAFLINIIIAFSQFFTVLFCLVGWGWSIWWGVIMLKVARKHKKFKHLEKIEQATFQPGANPARTKDPVRAT